MRLVCSVGAFFEMGSESERVALGQLMSEQAQALRSWGHERWTAILERRKTTAVEIELAAPRLLLPEDLSRPLASVRMRTRPQFRAAKAHSLGLRGNR